MRFDLVDLALFVAVADARSITGGAARTNLALASASERIKRLEQTLGAALIERRRRGIVLTAAGECLLGHARIVLHQVEMMRGEIANFASGVRARIRLLANTAGAIEHLPGLLAGFLAPHPEISVDVEEMESAEIALALAAGAADLGLAVDAALPPNLQRVPFCDDRLVLAVAQRDPLATRKRVAVAELAARAFVGLAAGSALQDHIAGQFARLGVRPILRARVKSFDAICQLVASGVGIAIVPEVALRRNMRAMRLASVRISDPWTERKLVICMRDRKALPRPVRQLFEHLRAAAAAQN